MSNLILISANNAYVKKHWLTKEDVLCYDVWEARVIDYLNDNKINYRWRSDVFVMPDGTSYRPDLYLIDKDTWVEIKTFMKPQAAKKFEEFRKIKPSTELWDKNKLYELGVITMPSNQQPSEQR